MMMKNKETAIHSLLCTLGDLDDDATATKDEDNNNDKNIGGGKPSAVTNVQHAPVVAKQVTNV